MLISFKNYTWINPETGRKPVRGDEFLYKFLDNSDESEKKHLCMDPSINPIKKHPIGFLGLLSFLFGSTFDGDIQTFILILFMLSLISGTLISFISYVFFYFKEKKWKRQVILDWKSGKLKYNSSESILVSSKNIRIPLDENIFF